MKAVNLSIPETKTKGPSVKGSADALLEVLACARQKLANLYNIRSQGATGNDLIKIEHLRRENELLKKEWSELEKMMKEKL